ncbi:hypothetical protein TNIN_490141 [Trichonephila inaurata madagascariensis]|uniref:Uncharacterized protein n=1 Tax=Trichonephila inaurata madagascariensis TaxID=2747483 RepID=A0A8X6IMA3_9ARAC|nr:hypothetical protein TNIN_490141 [Trichonephila inaurata madagascariensis]
MCGDRKDHHRTLATTSSNPLVAVWGMGKGKGDIHPLILAYRPRSDGVERLEPGSSRQGDFKTPVAVRKSFDWYALDKEKGGWLAHGVVPERWRVDIWMGWGLRPTLWGNAPCGSIKGPAAVVRCLKGAIVPKAKGLFILRVAPRTGSLVDDQN